MIFSKTLNFIVIFFSLGCFFSCQSKRESIQLKSAHSEIDQIDCQLIPLPAYSIKFNSIHSLSTSELQAEVLDRRGQTVFYKYDLEAQNQIDASQWIPISQQAPVDLGNSINFNTFEIKQKLSNKDQMYLLVDDLAKKESADYYSLVFKKNLTGKLEKLSENLSTAAFLFGDRYLTDTKKKNNKYEIYFYDLSAKSLKPILIHSSVNPLLAQNYVSGNQIKFVITEGDGFDSEVSIHLYELQNQAKLIQSWTIHAMYPGKALFIDDKIFLLPKWNHDHAVIDLYQQASEKPETIGYFHPGVKIINLLNSDESLRLLVEEGGRDKHQYKICSLSH